MRADGSLIQSLVQQASALSNRQGEISRELGSGNRLSLLANDPLAAAASVRLSGSIAASSATLVAVQTTQAQMQTADAALGATVDRLTAAISLAVSGATDTVNASNRAGIADQLSSIRDAVLGLGNSSYNGSYLFAGTSDAGAPFTKDPMTDAVTYTGDGDHSSITVQGTLLQSSMSGSDIFGTGASSVFSVLQSAVATLNAGSAPSSAQISALRDALQTVITQRSVLAASASRLEEARTYTTTQQTNLQAQQTAVAATDTVALATELSATHTQRSALLSSLAVLGKQSLFDYL